MHRCAGVLLGLAVAISGCATLRDGKKQEPPPPAATVPTVRTVPPKAEATPSPTSAEKTPVATLPVRPIKNPDTEKLKKQGKVVGPIITFAGIARADGTQIKPTKIENGVPVYENLVGSGFQVVIEAKPGLSALEVGRKLFTYRENDPKARPDLEMQVDRPLGDGSAAVCDRMRPKIGGVAAIKPPSFAETLPVARALNDMACRFEIFTEPESACVVDQYGDFDFISDESKIQFCMVVARAWHFQEGDTLVSVRLRDVEGNPGPVSKFRLRRPKALPTPVAKPKTAPTPEPTAPRRRP